MCTIASSTDETTLIATIGLNTLRTSPTHSPLSLLATSRRRARILVSQPNAGLRSAAIMATRSARHLRGSEMTQLRYTRHSDVFWHFRESAVPAVSHFRRRHRHDSSHRDV